MGTRWKWFHPSFKLIASGDPLLIDDYWRRKVERLAECRDNLGKSADCFIDEAPYYDNLLNFGIWSYLGGRLWEKKRCEDIQKVNKEVVALLISLTFLNFDYYV